MARRSEPSQFAIQMREREARRLLGPRWDHWRALGYRDVELGEHSLTWFWIGSHADYDKLQRFPVEWNRRAITISPLSSPAKAGDPVTPGAAEYWIPAFAGNDIAMILLEREPL
jgi:hypothetical protein